VQQVWFPGVHADIGGGYADDSFLWHEPFKWLVGEAVAAGLPVDPGRFRERIATPRPVVASKEKKHNPLLNPLWWICEIFPKMPKPWRIRVNLFRSREIFDGELLHESALRRLRENRKYNPANLSRGFRRYVREQLSDNQIAPLHAYSKIPPVAAEPQPST